MSRRSRIPLSALKRTELQVAAAVAREAVLQTHVTRALMLIELAGDQVSVLRMLDIYVRVNALTGGDAEFVTNRLLAVVGRKTRKHERAVVYIEGDEKVASTGGLLTAVRDRLRGRRLHDLRRWVELHTGATQAVLIEVHVRHALKFVAQLNETHTISASVDVYCEMLNVPRNMADAVYIYVLDRMANTELPAAAERPAPEEQIPVLPQQNRPKRVV